MLQIGAGDSKLRQRNFKSGQRLQIGAEQLNPGVHSYKLFTSKIVAVDFKSV